MSANASPITTTRSCPTGTLPGQTGYRDGAAMPAFPFASFGKRLLAEVVDSAVATAILLLPVALGVVAIVISVGTDDNGDVNSVSNGGMLASGVIAIVLGVVCALLSEPLLTARKGVHNGQTVGKRVAGVRITDLRGGRVSTGQAWGRALFKEIFSGKLLYLGYLWML